MNQGKERFGNPGIENLYQRWRAGEITENTVRSESVKFQDAFAGRPLFQQP